MVSLKSPKGGRQMVHFDQTRRPETILFHKRETGEPVILDDIYTYTVGYASKMTMPGDRQYMKHSDVQAFIERVAPEFGYVKKKKWF